ncbi:hypothetical protein [Nocardia sp. NPDC049149]|uniref:LppU/SCO3897 family protein n=1 Tax=Nocardia sp. NPDC049149 TaxID=3364315 RepID=UPI00370F9AB3
MKRSKDAMYPVSGDGRRLARHILLFAAVLTLVTGGIAAAVMASWSGPPRIEVGQCAKLSGLNYRPELVPKECGDPDANYVVALRVDRSSRWLLSNTPVSQRVDHASPDCPNRDYVSFYEASPDDYTLCLRLNVAEGDCVSDDALLAAAKVSSCRPGVDFKVNQIFAGRADRSVCGITASARDTILYPKPDPLTLCLTRVR